jgi:hypothetical protein
VSAERDVLVAQMLVAAPWLDELAANVLLDGTDEERKLIIAARATASVTEGPEVWQKLLNVLTLAGNVASAVSGISGAITGVYGVAKVL